MTVDWMEAARQKRIDDANLIPHAVITWLPRLEVRHGGTWLALDRNRMMISRGIPPFQLASHLERHDGVTFWRDGYGDCPHCRRERLNRAEARGPLPDSEASYNDLKVAMKGWVERELYWCNDCQATGLLLEPWARAVERLGIVTHEALVKALSPAELQEAIAQERKRPLDWRLHGKGFPPGLLLDEAAKRLAEVTA